MFIDEVIESYSNGKAHYLDEQLKKFLTEHSIPAENPALTLVALKELGFELLQDVQRTDSQEVYTFKLCKVFAQKSVNIPIPKFVV